MSTVSDATKRLQQHYISSRFSSSVDEWPPYQPKHYTTLAFIHNKGKSTNAVRFSVTEELAVAGKINASQICKHTDLLNTNMTKNISEIFLPAKNFDGSFVDLCILIEGAPGIGKTVLTKEISYLWANNELLVSKNLLLLVFLRECHQKPLRSIEDLVQFVFKSSEMTAHLTSYLSQTDGRDAIIIFDGYDELSEVNKTESIIMDIINRRVLAKCCLVITSRPTASSNLYGIVNCRVEIVGFTEEDRLDYIQTALKYCDEQVKALQYYLQSYPTINALCYIPLNMTILLCLFEDGVDKLPKTQTEMYRKFIEMTIVRFIKKYENCNTIICIDNLHHPHDKLFAELAKLAYEALKTDKIVFLLSEIKKGCPNLTMTSSNWNGLGLLKAAQYFSVKIGNNQVTFHFLHFSLQEYMAAWYISKLSEKEQIKLLKETFWEPRYYNTWIMYVGITCGSSFALRHFLSGNRFKFYSKLIKSSKVSNKYLKHKMKCLHLFQCLIEASKEDIIDSVKQLFENSQIDLSNQTLLPSDLNTLGFFLIRSLNKKWNVLNLSKCNIGSNGSSILCDRFLDKDVRSIVTIKMVNFSYNQLNFSSLMQLFGLFYSWRTSEIIIDDDTLLDNMLDIKAIENAVLHSNTLTLVFIGSYLFSKNLQSSNMYHILSSTTKVKIIYLLNCVTSYSENLALLKLLEKQKLNKVRIIGPSLDKMFIQTIALILLRDNTSVNMLVYDPTMPDKIADDIADLLSSSKKSKSGVMLIVSSSKIQGFINTCTLNNELSALEMFNLNIYIRSQHLNASLCLWNEKLEGQICNDKSNVYTFLEILYKIDYNWKLKIILRENNILILHKGTFDLDQLTHFTENVSIAYLSSCHDIGKFTIDIINESCSALYIYNSPYCIEFLHAKLFHEDYWPNELFIFGNIKYSFIKSLAELMSCYYDKSTVLVANGILVAFHPKAHQIAQAFQFQPSTTTWILSTAQNARVFFQVIDVLTVLDTEWIELDFTGCDVSDTEYEMIYEAFAYKNCSTVKKLSISFNNLSILGIPFLAKTILRWRVKKLCINGTKEVLYNHLIEKLISECKHQVNFFISITYNQKICHIICNASWNKVLTKIYCVISELYIINCELHLSLTEIISCLCTIKKLSRLCVIGGTISEEILIEILKAFSNKTIEVSISNVKITDGDRMIRNLIFSKQFCKSSLVLSTDHWLCVCNATNYQLQLIHRYFTQLNYDGMTLVRKIERINGGKVYIFEQDQIKLIRFLDKMPQTTSDKQIVNILSDITSLNTIEINNCSIKSAEYLAYILHRNAQLHELQLNGNAFQTSNIIKLAKALQGICVYDENTTEDSPKHIVSSFSDNATLRECNNIVHSVSMTDKTMNLHKVIPLKILSISHNNIVDKAADDIAAAISCNVYLQELNLSDNNLQALGTMKIARSLQKISALTKLSIDHNNITHKAADDIAIAISCNIHLQELNLSGNNLQALGTIKVVKGLHNVSLLTKLFIDHNDITHEAAYEIATVISRSTHLQELNLSGNNLQALGAIKIARSLQKISTLTKLFIDYNNITDEAADEIAIAVSHNTHLQELNLGGNHLKAIGAAKIAKSLQNISTLTKLFIDHNNITDEAADDIAAAISHNTHLQELYLSGNNLQALGIIKIARSLQKISTLTKLSINHNNITDEAADDIATAISSNIFLEEFSNGGNNFQTVSAIKIAKSLQNVSTLTKLCIDNSNITQDAADDISAVISCNTEMKELDISGNNLQAIGVMKIAKALQAIKTLKKLHIGNNSITDEAADDIAAAISCNIYLQEFDIGRNNLRAIGAIKIAKGLQTISTLTKLHINNNNITHEAAGDIAAAICCNSQLQEFDIGRNNLQTVDIIKITKSLQSISTLKKLYIYDNDASVKAANDIAAVISCNSHLQELDLTVNKLCGLGAKVISEAVQAISTLTKLCIDNNKITNEAAYAVAGAISCNTHLQEFSIGANDLQTSGAITIARGLQYISTITKLYINNNRITDRAADDIARAILCNPKIKEFDIGKNCFQTLGAIKIMKALQKILSLTKLYIDHNNIGGEAANDIIAVIGCNSCIQVKFDGNKFRKKTVDCITSYLDISKQEILTDLEDNYVLINRSPYVDSDSDSDTNLDSDTDIDSDTNLDLDINNYYSDSNTYSCSDTDSDTVLDTILIPPDIESNTDGYLTVLR